MSLSNTAYRSRHFVRGMLCALVLFLSPHALAQAPTQPTGDRWVLVENPTSIQVHPSRMIEGELARYRVTIDERAFAEDGASRGDVVSIELPDGIRDFVVSRVDQHVPGTRSIAAVGTPGSPDLMTLTRAETGILGIIRAGADLFHVRPGEKGGAVMVRVDPEALDEIECLVNDIAYPEELAPPGASGGPYERAGRAVHMPAMASSMDGPITIDLMIVYTELSDAWAISEFGSMAAVVAQSLSLQQLALDNSEVNVTLRVVHLHKTDYDENGPPMSGQTIGGSHLRRITANTTHPPFYNPWGSEAAGFMEEVHGLRAQHGADLVALIANGDGTAAIAWILGNPGGFPQAGFSVASVQHLPYGFTFVHEIGHNLGLHHARQQSQQAAPARGGLFEYSTGWYWSGTDGTLYNTLMAYFEQGSQRMPYFSSPEIIVEGGPTGSYVGPGAPADNARTMREIKRTVAAYHPTQVDPPVAVVDVAPIIIDVPFGDIITKTLSIANTGNSDLVWEMDFIPPTPAQRGGTVTGAALALGAPPQDLVYAVAAGNLSPSAVLSHGDKLIIYGTTFSVEDGFTPGVHTIHGGMNAWWAGSNLFPFEISTENPSVGLQHLRLPAQGSLPTTTLFGSGSFGAWPTGAYEFSVDISISTPGGSDYFVLLQDGQTGAFTAGVTYAADGGLLLFDPQSGQYVSSGRDWTPGQYERLVLYFDPYEQQVRYQLDQEPLGAMAVSGGTAPGRVFVQRVVSGGADGTGQMDLDDIVYESSYRGFEWLSASSLAGVTPPEAPSAVELIASGPDLEPGAYAADIVLHTNDPERRVIHVPVQVNILPIGTDVGPGLAGASRLLGNSPNPFTSSTRIDYEIVTAAVVRLEVFSVTGQRVLLLVDGYHSPGTYQQTLSAAGFASGVYIYRLTTDDTVDAGRMAIVR